MCVCVCSTKRKERNISAYYVRKSNISYPTKFFKFDWLNTVHKKNFLVHCWCSLLMGDSIPHGDAGNQSSSFCGCVILATLKSSASSFRMRKVKVEDIALLTALTWTWHISFAPIPWGRTSDMMVHSCRGETKKYSLWIRSPFPVVTVHCGREAWILVDSESHPPHDNEMTSSQLWQCSILWLKYLNNYQ